MAEFASNTQGETDDDYGMRGDLARRMGLMDNGPHEPRLARTLADALGEYDKEADPANSACPTGGCQEDKKLNRDIYNDLLEGEAKKADLRLDEPDERRQAHMRVVDIMRPRVRENRKYEESDKSGPPEAAGPEFIIKDRGIYYPGFGKSLQAMYADQKRLRPDQYDPREHATMTLMEQAFVNGATRVSHVSHNRDSEGKEAIRDQIIMIVDPETGQGRMEIRNIAQDGHYLTTKEAYDKMAASEESFVEGHPREGIFIFTDAPVDSRQVHTILDASESGETAVSVGTRDRLRHVRADGYDPASPVNGPDRRVETMPAPEAAHLPHIDQFMTLAGDLRSLITIPRFIKQLLADDPESSWEQTDLPRLRTENVTAVHPGLTGDQAVLPEAHEALVEALSAGLTRLNSETENHQDERHETSKDILLKLLTGGEHPPEGGMPAGLFQDVGIEEDAGFDEASVQKHWKKKAEALLGISEAQSEALVEGVEAMWESVQRKKDVLTLLVRMPVGAAAGLYILNALTLEEKPSVFSGKMPPEADSGQPLEYKREEIEAIFLLFVDHHEKTEPGIKENTAREFLADYPEDIRIPDGVDLITLIKTIETVHELDVLAPADRMERLARKQHDTVQAMVGLWEAVSKILPATRSLSVESPDSVYYPRQIAPEAVIKNSEQERPVGEFSLALAVWYMLKLMNYHAMLSALTAFLQQKQDTPDGMQEQGLLAVIGEKKPEALIRKEPAPWLLFAIIWQLAMIREQGMAQSAGAQTMQGKKQKAAAVPAGRRIQRAGIIFTFSS